MNALYRALGISKQSVHKHISRFEKQMGQEAQLFKYVRIIRIDHPTMSVRDLYYMISPEFIGRDKFEEFCRVNDLMSQKEKTSFLPRTTDSSGVTRFKNLLTGTKVTRINQVWQSDITYFEINRRFYFLTFILDAFSRRILGYSTSNGLSTEYTTLPALQMAIKTRRGHKIEGLIFHSDGGGQYYDAAFLTLTKIKKFENSMCEYAWDNGKAERLNGVIKNNYLIHWQINSFAELVKMVDRAVLLYNTQKPHKALGRLAPCVFEEKHITSNKQNPPRMMKSFKANLQNERASSPRHSEQNPPRNPNVFSANNYC